MTKNGKRIPTRLNKKEWVSDKACYFLDCGSVQFLQVVSSSVALMPSYLVMETMSPSRIQPIQAAVTVPGSEDFLTRKVEQMMTFVRGPFIRVEILKHWPWTLLLLWDPLHAILVSGFCQVGRAQQSSLAGARSTIVTQDFILYIAVSLLTSLSLIYYSDMRSSWYTTQVCSSSKSRQKVSKVSCQSFSCLAR